MNYASGVEPRDGDEGEYGEAGRERLRDARSKKRLRSFIAEAVAEGAIALPISTIIELLTRMRNLSQELSRQLAWKNRKHPASETTHRLQPHLHIVALLDPGLAHVERSATVVAARGNKL